MSSTCPTGTQVRVLSDWGHGFGLTSLAHGLGDALGEVGLKKSQAIFSLSADRKPTGKSGGILVIMVGLGQKGCG